VETDVEKALEGSTLVAVVAFDCLGDGELAIGLFDTREVFIEIELLEGTTGEEETCSVAGGPVGQTVLDSVSLELVSVGCAEDLVACNLSGDELANDVSVGEADDQSVLRSVVLVLGLRD
jgi:hypothetical protein